MGVLRGAERALRDTKIHYINMEYQPSMLATAGTDHEGILHYLAHYGFQCYSLKLPDYSTPMSFKAFADQYRTPERLRLRGMGSIEDVMCENMYWTGN